MSVSSSQRLLDQLAAARRRLIETGTRNRLVHVNRSLTRANVLNLVNERADSVYTLLRRDGKRLRFHALLPPADRPQGSSLAPIETLDADAAAARYNDTRLETPLTPEALAKRLLRLANNARTAEEEQGVNLLYLAIGFLTWLEPTSPPTPRQAPLVLLPVELVRNQRSSTYDLRVRDEDISTNLPLQERLQQDFGLPLPDINEDEEWLPSAYFAELQPLIAERPGWSIEADALQLGFFSFSRLLLLNDLDPARWPQQELLTNPLVINLLGRGFPAEAPRFDPRLPLDSVLDPAQLIHVVDADASQTRVIEEVRRGGNLVVQGPPGTGKSQTIANIIAGAVHDGKTVLFVAEKMAALRVVHDRLVSVGLRDVCLELHTRSANKKVVIEELGRALLSAQQPLSPPDDPARLREQRDTLNQITAELHTPLTGRDYRPYDALAELVGLIGRGLPPPSQRVDSLARLSERELEQLAQSLALFARLREECGPREAHPFAGVQALDLQPPDLERLLHGLDGTIRAIDVARDAAAALPTLLGLPTPDGMTPAAAGRALFALLHDTPPIAHEDLAALLRWSDQPELLSALSTADEWQRRAAELRSWCRDGVLDSFDATLLPLLHQAQRRPLSRLSAEYQQACLTLRNLIQQPAAADLPARESPLSTAVTALIEPPDAREQHQAQLSDLLTRLGLPLPRDAAQLRHTRRLLDEIADAPPQSAPLLTLLWPYAADERIIAALQAHQQWQQERLELERTFSYAAWTTDVSAYREAALRGAASFFARFGRPYRQAGAILGALLRERPPRDPAARAALYDRIIAAQQQRALLTRDEPLLQQILQHEWLGDRTDFARVLATAQWLQRVQRFNLLQSPEALRDLISADHLPIAVPDLHDQLSEQEEYRLTQRIVLLEQLQQARDLRTRFRAAVPLLADQLGEFWRGAQTDTAGLVTAIAWMQRARRLPHLRDLDDLRRSLALSDRAARAAQLAEFDRSVAVHVAEVAALLQINDLPHDQLQDDAVLLTLHARLTGMQQHAGRYGEWALLHRNERHLQQAGLSNLAALVNHEALSPDEAYDRFRYLVAEARWQDVRLQRPTLEQHTRRDRHAIVRLFRAAEEQRLREIPDLVLSGYRRRLQEDPGQAIGFLRAEIARKRRHKAIRQLMQQAATTIQRIKPVLLMSPITVAQFLPAGSVTFDLLLIDEASQVRPEDALGAVARARQIVVVGDQQQLPPTSFFERLADDAEDDEDELVESADGEIVPAAGVTDMESILTLCEARGLHRRMLEWHYRSRVPSLITVSNEEFYDGRLVLPPSPLQRDSEHGMILRRVNGVYHPRGAGVGRGGSNRIEAEAVAAAVAEHARHRSQLSLGIVAFSQVQRDMLVDVLDEARRRDRTLDTFMAENRREPLFVKNIENVQGDERDVILISVGYGPTSPGGVLSSMNFGPVNTEGGARRLNVLFSRARIRCEIFASFDPDQIDPARASREGPRVLQRFLRFARDGKLPDQRVEASVVGPFEQDVAAVIRTLGAYEVEQGIGSNSLRLDLAVRSTGADHRYLLAVQGDGAHYRDAPWARERDRLRDSVLSNLGWRVHRIWLTDWYSRRSAEISRLQRALADAEAAAQAPTPPTPPPAEPEVEADPVSPPDPPTLDDATRAELLTSALRSTSGSATAADGTLRYRRAQVTVEAAIDVHEAPATLLERLVREIVQQEGPLHRNEIVRRVAAAFDKGRAGSRISDIVDAALLRAQRLQPGTLLRSEQFWMTPEQRRNPPVRDRRLEPGMLKAELLPPHEIRAAAARIGITAADPSAEQLRAVAQLLGFQRGSAEINEVIRRALQPT